MLIPFNFSIDFLMAYKQNNYQHIAFLLSHLDDTNWKPTNCTAREHVSSVASVRASAEVLRAFDVPPQLAQLL